MGVDVDPGIEPLPANQPPARFYMGGPRIAAFRGDDPCSDRQPEDWVASTTTVRGREREGLTVLADGTLLRDRIAADPVTWLGEEHLSRFGPDPLLLVKLLDAGQRLPVHAHPDGAFAARHLHAAHGKAEAWYILEPGFVHLGLRRDVSDGELLELVSAQDTGALLARTHRVEVAAGDTVYVPPGLLHAIGAGVFLLEVQEPEDLSILLEWRDFELDGERDGHLGLGFETALRAVRRTASSAQEIAGLIVRGPGEGSVLAPAADEFFRLDHHRVDGATTLDGGFGVVVVVSGAVRIGDGHGFVPAPAGAVLLVPHAAGRLDVHGDGVVLIARPPAP